MSAESSSGGWILHSKGRKFGPLTEDELRGYFRAGMVQSVDRLTAPDDSAMRAAGEVATMLGETPPAGPPPESLDAPPIVAPPIAATGAPLDPAREERAAKALAAANIDFAALASAGSPRRGERNPWLVPIVAVVVLVALLVIALNMLNRLKNAAPPPPQHGFEQVPPVGAPVNDDGAAFGDSPRTASPRPVSAAGPVADASWDAKFEESRRKAEQLSQANDWAGLVAHSDAWSRERPDRNEPLQSLGIAYARLGNYDAAADALNRVLTRDRGNAAARVTLADVYAQSKRWSDAVALYQEMVQADSQNARLWNNYGAALTETGQHAQAIAALETAVKLDPKFKEAWINLGNTYQRTGDSARAAAAFASAKG